MLLKEKKYFIHAIVAALLFGVATPFSKLLLGKMNPVLLAALFYLGAAFSLIPFSRKNFKREVAALKRNRTDLYRILGAILFGGILGPVALLYGIKLTTATTASLLLNFETVATTFLAWIFFKEHVGFKVVLSSLLVILAGTLLIVDLNFNFNMGGLLIVLGCFCWGFDNNFTATVEGISPETNTILKGLVGGGVNLAIALTQYEFVWNTTGILGALVIGAFSYGVSIVLYIMSARNLGAARSQIIFSINPFLGAIVSYLIFFNPLNVQFFVAFFVMIIATLMLFYEKHEHGHIHSKETHEHPHSHDDNHHSHTHEGLDPKTVHTHVHDHEEVKHSHSHYPDIHHRHTHND